MQEKSVTKCSYKNKTVFILPYQLAKATGLSILENLVWRITSLTRQGKTKEYG